jgi:hypothetical protein
MKSGRKTCPPSVRGNTDKSGHKISETKTYKDRREQKRNSLEIVGIFMGL